MSPATVVRSARMLARIMPDAEAEGLVGDLIEEYQLRLHAGPRAAARWYWKQFAGSIPSLVWASARRGAWLRTLAVAVASYLVVGIVEYALSAVVTAMPAPGVVRSLLLLLAGLVALTAGGYVAASFRREAVGLLALFVLVATCSMMSAAPGSAPMWYQLAFLVLGPLSPMMGAVWQTARKRPSR